MATTQRKKWVKVEEVLSDLDIPRRTWQRWRALGKTPECVRLPSGGLRIDPDVYAKWLDSLREEEVSA